MAWFPSDYEHAKPVENAGAFELVPLLFRIAVGAVATTSIKPKRGNTVLLTVLQSQVGALVLA